MWKGLPLTASLGDPAPLSPAQGPGSPSASISSATPSLPAAFSTRCEGKRSYFPSLYLVQIPLLAHFGFFPHCPQAFLPSGAIFFCCQLLEAKACYFSGLGAKFVFNFCSRWHSTLDASAGASNLSESSDRANNLLYSGAV